MVQPNNVFHRLQDEGKLQDHHASLAKATPSLLQREQAQRRARRLDQRASGEQAGTPPHGGAGWAIMRTGEIFRAEIFAKA